MINVPAAVLLMKMQRSLDSIDKRLTGLESQQYGGASSGYKLPPQTFPVKTHEALAALEDKLAKDEEFKKAVVSVIAP